MAQVLSPSRTSRTRIGAESTFGTVATNLRDLVLWNPEAKAPFRGATVKAFPNLSQRRYLRDEPPVVLGPRNGSPMEFDVAVKGVRTALTALTSPVVYSNSAALSHQVLWAHLLGAELTPAAGSTVASSTSTSVTVDTGHGSRFVAGQVIIVEVGASGGSWEPNVVLSVSGDAVSCAWAWTGTPYVSGAVRNAYNYHRPLLQSGAYSGNTCGALSVEHGEYMAATNTTEQRGLGCYFDPTFTLENGSVAMVSCKGASTSHTDPGDLTMTEVDVDDDMGAELVWIPSFSCQTALTAGSPSTAGSARSTFEAISTKVNVPKRWAEIPGMGGVQGVANVVDLGGRGDAADGLELELAHDDGEFTKWSAGTQRAGMLYVQSGSGASARLFGYYFPCLTTASVVRGSKYGIEVDTVRLIAQANRNIAANPNPNSSTALAASSVVMFMG